MKTYLTQKWQSAKYFI